MATATRGWSWVLLRVAERRQEEAGDRERGLGVSDPLLTKDEDEKRQEESH